MLHAEKYQHASLQEHLQEMWKTQELCRHAAAWLRKAEIPSPRREARLLLSWAAHRKQEWILAHGAALVSSTHKERFIDAVVRRCNGEPFSRIQGLREFYSLPFMLGANVFDPRPESETLVATALDFSSSLRSPKVLDLGCGSGCLLLAFLDNHREARGIGTDISPEALQVARRNATALNLMSRCCFLATYWGQGIQNRWSVILCNPPYVALRANLSPEVRKHDPPLALFAGDDGLQCYRTLCIEVRRLLTPGGRLFLEVGKGQANEVARIFVASRLQVESATLDFSGLVRCLVLRRS